MREDEGRKMLKPMVIAKLTRVMAISNGEDKQKIRSLIQKVRYKKYVLTKNDMLYVNDVFFKMKGSK